MAALQPGTRQRILITNGDSLRTVSFLRALAGASDIEVHVSAESRFAAAFFSRYCHNRFINVSPKQDPELFLRQLREYARKNRIDMLIPANETELQLILERRSEFEPEVELPFVRTELFKSVYDKWTFAVMAAELGITIPRTILPRTLAEVEGAELRYPVIIKVRESAGSRGVVKVSSRADLLTRYIALVEKWQLQQRLPLIQEYIENGTSIGAAAFCRRGEVRAVNIYQNLMMLPLRHGTSTARITIHDAGIAAQVTTILEHLGWHGIAQFDIIRKEGHDYFIEMNPRLYTSLAVTVKSGLNYPHYLCQINDNPEVSADYEEGVLCRVLMADVPAKVANFFQRVHPVCGRTVTAGKIFYDDLDWHDFWPTIPFFIKAVRGKLL